MPFPPGRILLLALVGLLAVGLACHQRDDVAPPLVPRVITMELVGDQLHIEEEVEVNWRQPVRWESPSDPYAVWVVVFADSTPFRGNNSRRVFNGGGPGNSANRGRLPQAPQGAPDRVEYKYWVFYPDGTDYRKFDPKLVIRR